VVEIINRIAVAISKHVIANNALAGGGIGVGVEETAGFGAVVAGLQIVEAGEGVEDVTAVAEGVEGAEVVQDGNDVALVASPAMARAALFRLARLPVSAEVRQISVLGDAQNRNLC